MHKILFYIYVYSSIFALIIGLINISGITKNITKREIFHGTRVDTIKISIFTFFNIILMSLMPIINTWLIASSFVNGIPKAFSILITDLYER